MDFGKGNDSVIILWGLLFDCGWWPGVGFEIKISGPREKERETKSLLISQDKRLKRRQICQLAPIIFLFIFFFVNFFIQVIQSHFLLKLTPISLSL